MGQASTRAMHAGFVRSCELFPDRHALEVAGETLTFAELGRRAAVLASALRAHTPDGGPPYTAVFARRSATAFAGVLAALLRGHAYVPLNPTFPVARTRSMLERSGARAVIVDGSGVDQLDEVLDGVRSPMLVVAPDGRDEGAVGGRWPGHTVLTARDLQDTVSPPPAPDPVDGDDVAYLLFTSGSTGTPKGVMVTHGNVTHFVDSVVDRYDVTEHDRLSQTFDMTFDLSVFDMFVAWERGACVCCPSGKTLLAPARFIGDSRLTMWFSVPSTAVIMQRLGLLKPDRFPGLRWSLFCGEALPAEVARAWASAAPSSTVENLYGPTEATIACTVYRWDPARSPDECELGLVPIGAPLPGMTASVVGPGLVAVPTGQEGELLVTGPQVAAGYLHDPQRTAAAFVVPPGERALHYRTGDRVRQRGPGEPLLYLGRIDDQIQVHGHRVEPGEVEAAIRAAAGVSDAAVVGWPRTAAGASGLVAFLAGEAANGEDIQRLRSRLEDRLPDYMVPREIRMIAELPRNANGKVDRRALVRLAEEGR